MNEYKLGSYHWYVNSSKPEDMDSKEWRDYQQAAVKSHLDSFGVQPGQEVKVKIGGGARELWHRGTAVFSGMDHMNGAFLLIKQTRQEKYIDAWRIIDIELLDGVKA